MVALLTITTSETGVCSLFMDRKDIRDMHPMIDHDLFTFDAEFDHNSVFLFDGHLKQSDTHAEIKFVACVIPETDMEDNDMGDHVEIATLYPAGTEREFLGELTDLVLEPCFDVFLKERFKDHVGSGDHGWTVDAGEDTVHTSGGPVVLGSESWMGQW